MPLGSWLPSYCASASATIIDRTGPCNLLIANQSVNLASAFFARHFHLLGTMLPVSPHLPGCIPAVHTAGNVCSALASSLTIVVIMRLRIAETAVRIIHKRESAMDTTTVCVHWPQGPDTELEAPLLSQDPPAHRQWQRQQQHCSVFRQAFPLLVPHPRAHYIRNRLAQYHRLGALAVPWHAQ